MNDRPMPWREVGRHMGISGQRARVIGEQAIAKLRQGMIETGVCDLLELAIQLHNDEHARNTDNISALLGNAPDHYSNDEADPQGKASLRKYVDVSD